MFSSMSRRGFSFSAGSFSVGLDSAFRLSLFLSCVIPVASRLSAASSFSLVMGPGAARTTFFDSSGASRKYPRRSWWTAFLADFLSWSISDAEASVFRRDFSSSNSGSFFVFSTEFLDTFPSRDPRESLEILESREFGRLIGSESISGFSEFSTSSAQSETNFAERDPHSLVPFSISRDSEFDICDPCLL